MSKVPVLLVAMAGSALARTEARVAGTSRRWALYKVVLPAALSSVLKGCRVGLVSMAIVVFLAEMITSAT